MSNETDDSLLRLRRCKSVTQAENIQKVEAELRKAQPDRPCHKPRDSLFSWASGFSNFTGFVNWAFLLLSVGGSRLFLENIIKYGIRVDPSQWLIVITGSQEGGPEHLSIMLLLYSLMPVLICYILEKGLSKDIISHASGCFIHIINIVLLILLPMIVIHCRADGFSLIGASSVCFTYCILFLKLWSYIQVNMWCRMKADTKLRTKKRSMSGTTLDSEINGNHVSDDSYEKKLVKYPDNLTLKDLMYFMLAPTLCYELNFPRTCRIRKRFLFKRAVEVLVGFHVLGALFQQWIIPSVKNSLIPFSL
ncbi:hypothetical protein RUM44_007079 [Polyplax serrata]|uniref:diacylglycerol O-acyltransferase n=1 Tax=Polyplax serrata TaxID=468196 RepID=A0ABR1AZQ6_POLSC